mgnify:CR=1 FL=1
MGRLSRLHHLLRALRRRPTDGWAALAFDGGFCDQSHLVNEFQSLCGLTPTVEKVFRLTRMDSIFIIHDHLPDGRRDAI